ncbi:MAG: HI0074 family nucleotidyltransferase substrate-binding subunit [Candidatus Dependentiae bacterium]|nr:HI0074 family nucleotidyltransferase substrate-binding subunit [Candidatus Dependentiae bacterium]
MKKETELIFQQLEKALLRLEEVVNLPISKHKVEIEATIQCFEFTIELFWKALKKKLSDEFNTESFGPKQVLQYSYAKQLISNEKHWLNMLTDRNMTSHTYKEALALQIYQNIKMHTPFLRQEFEFCKIN